MEREELGAAGNLWGGKDGNRAKPPMGRPPGSCREPLAGRRRATRTEPHPAPPACGSRASTSPLQQTRTSSAALRGIGLAALTTP